MSGQISHVHHVVMLYIMRHMNRMIYIILIMLPLSHLSYVHDYLHLLFPIIKCHDMLSYQGM